MLGKGTNSPWCPAKFSVGRSRLAGVEGRRRPGFLLARREGLGVLDLRKSCPLSFVVGCCIVMWGR